MQLHSSEFGRNRKNLSVIMYVVSLVYIRLYKCRQPFSISQFRFQMTYLHDRPASSDSCCGFQPLPTPLERVVQKTISANPGLKFNWPFILVCSAWQLKLKLFKVKHFIICMISEQKFSNIFVYIFIILSPKFPLILARLS